MTKPRTEEERTAVCNKGAEEDASERLERELARKMIRR